MAAFSATLIWGELSHPVRSLRKQWSRRVAVAPTPSPSSSEAEAPSYRRPSPERLERIAAYARCGYFHMDYTAGMFVAPVDLPPE